MRALSVELRYLIYTGLLLAVIWLPYVNTQIMKVGLVKVLSYTDEDDLPAWAVRLKRAHYNLVENIPLFAIAVLAGEIRNVHTGVTAACAMTFFWARLAHPIAQVAQVWGTRSLVFAIGWVAVLVHLIAVLVAR